MNQLRSETTAAIDIVKSALVIAGRGTGDLRFKVGRDVVTDTDVAIENFIRTAVEDALGLPMIGEESGGDVTSAKPYWLVDPICGTRNFASGIPLFSVNMALVESEQVVIAVVGDGSTGDIYFAEQGQGAWTVADGEHHRLQVSPASQVVNIDSWPPAGPDRDRAALFIAAAIQADKWDVRALSTTLTLAYLSAGRIAADIRFSCPALHDGAGVLLASESGAKLSDIDGRPWTIGSGSLVASANEELHEELIRLHRQGR